jgi:hypothetical protein
MVLSKEVPKRFITSSTIKVTSDPVSNLDLDITTVGISTNRYGNYQA